MSNIKVVDLEFPGNGGIPRMIVQTVADLDEHMTTMGKFYAKMGDTEQELKEMFLSALAGLRESGSYTNVINWADGKSEVVIIVKDDLPDPVPYIYIQYYKACRHLGNLNYTFEDFLRVAELYNENDAA